MAQGWTGKQSAGKSQLLAVHAVQVYYRNVAWIIKRKKMGCDFFPRTMAFDSPMSDEFVKMVESAGLVYVHFRTFNDIMPLVEIDIFIHEIVSWFPQRGSEPLLPEQVEFLSQCDKEGIEIYFCTQDFSLVHKQFRLHVTNLKLVFKLIGSRRPTRSSPPVKHIWGVVLCWDLDPSSFNGDDVSIERQSLMPSFYLINREDTQLYNTSYRVKGVKKPDVKLVPQDNVYFDVDGNEIKRVVRYVKK